MTHRGDVDVVVIGAGPAGGRAALGLARAGRRVLIAEKQPWPRPKVCGCCLNSAALDTLNRAGLNRALAARRPQPLHTLEMRCGPRRAQLRLPHGVSLSRPALDGMLVEAAVQAGAVFRHGVSARVHMRPEQPDNALHHVSLGTESITTPCVVVADGLSGTALRDWPAFATTAHPAARVGMGVHLAPDHPLGQFVSKHTVTMLCGRLGYLGLVRLEDGSIDVAAAADRRALKQAGGPAALARVIAADAGVSLDILPTAPWRMTAPLTRSRQRLAGPGVFVVGDAAGYVEPFTGEGMAWALAGGAAVVPHAHAAVARRRPDAERAWATAHRRTVARRQRGCRAVAALLRRPRLTRAAVAVLSVAPVLATPLVPGQRLSATGSPA